MFGGHNRVRGTARQSKRCCLSIKRTQAGGDQCFADLKILRDCRAFIWGIEIAKELSRTHASSCAALSIRLKRTISNVLKQGR